MVAAKLMICIFLCVESIRAKHTMNVDTGNTSRGCQAVSSKQWECVKYSSSVRVMHTAAV
jgi:hypothetical protein